MIPAPMQQRTTSFTELERERPWAPSRPE